MKDSSKKTEGFSQRLAKLEKIYNEIKVIEAKDVEHLLSLYQEGVVLARKLEDELQQFEQRISMIESQDIDFTAVSESNEESATDKAPAPDPAPPATDKVPPSREAMPTFEEPTTPSSIPPKNEDEVSADYVTDLFSGQEE